MLEDLKLGERYDGFLFLAEAARNPPILRPHRHVELEVNLVVEGEITYVVDGRRMSFSKRTLLWMFPDRKHQLVDRSRDAKYYVAVFKPKMIRGACRGDEYRGLKYSSPLDGELVPHVRLLPDDFDLLCRMMEALQQDGLDPEVLNREAGFGYTSDFRFEHGDPDWLNAGLRHLLLQSWRLQRGRSGLTRQVALHPCVRRALSLLEDGAWEGSAASLAKQCGVSAAYLSRVFARQIGVPLTRYRNSARLTRFWREYRKEKSLTFAEAVFAAGFGSYAQFYKVFTLAYGHGPRAALKTNGPSPGAARFFPQKNGREEQREGIHLSGCDRRAKPTNTRQGPVHAG